jgi:hypothetical protein
MGSSCSNAIFVVRSAVYYLIERSSSIYDAALDTSEAYDSVQHYKLFSGLVRAGVCSCVSCLPTSCLLQHDGTAVTRPTLEIRSRVLC